MLKRFSKIPKGQEGWLSRITRYLTDSGNALIHAAENLQKHTTTGFKLIAKIPSIIKHKYSTNDEDNKRSDIIPLSGRTVTEIRPDTKNITSILGNEFVENKANTIRLAKDYVTTQDSLLGDRNIPLKNISKFLGIEDGILKIGIPNEFQANTRIIPVRNKKSLPITEFIKPEFNEALRDSIILKYDKDCAEWWNTRDSIIQEAINRNNITAPKVRRFWKNQVFNGLEGFPKFIKPIMFPFYGLAGILTTPFEYFRDAEPDDINATFNEYSEDEAKELTGVSKVLWDSIKADYENKIPRFPKRVNLKLPQAVTVNNDTINLDPNLGNGKLFLVGDEDNSYFINNLFNLTAEQANQLNSNLKDHPAIPVMIDNGRYSSYFPDGGSYKVYTSGDWDRDPNNMFIIGTVK